MGQYTKYQGTPSEYRMLHYWVEKQLGKPKLCVECGATEAKRFEWANLSGEYRKDISDWKRLCTPCHKKFDGDPLQGNTNIVSYRNRNATHCIRGHEFNLSNTGKGSNNGRRCKTCSNEQLRQWKRRKRLAAKSQSAKEHTP